MTDILVVDDERDIRELICDILEDEGFSRQSMAGTSLTRRWPRSTPSRRG